MNKAARAQDSDLLGEQNGRRMNSPILTVDNLSVHYENGNGGMQALDRISFSVRPQEFLVVLGPSGCGKTTLLRVLAGLQQPFSGRVRFHSQPGSADHGVAESTIRPEIGYVFQQANLMPWRTVLQNITLPLELKGTPAAEAQQQARDLLDLVGLHGFEETLPRDLSGGMAHRVAIARSLVHAPEILLLDEPFGSLDALTRERMGIELLRVWQARRKTVIMVTHDINEAIFLADRVLVLSPRPGRIRLDLEVKLGRPRLSGMRYTENFGEMARQVRLAIGQENHEIHAPKVGSQQGSVPGPESLYG